MNIKILDRITESLKAANIPVDGVSRNQGQYRIDYSPEATQEQRTAGQAILESLDLSDEAQAEWERVQARKQALAALATAKEIDSIASRCAITDLYAAINDLREFLGLARYTHAEVLQRISDRMNAGGGDPYS